MTQRLRRIHPGSTRFARLRALLPLAAAGMMATAAAVTAQEGDGGGSPDGADIRAHAGDGERSPMTIVDMIEVPSVSSAHLSPDGKGLVYQRSEADWDENQTISHIWRIGTDGTGETQLTTGSEGASSPRWSPDGRWIAFLAQREDQEDTQIWLLPTDGGEGRELTDHRTSVSDISWSPDGEWIYFRAEEPLSEEEEERREAGHDVYRFDDEDRPNRLLWRASVPSGEVEEVSDPAYDVRGYELSRDGTMVAVHKAPTALLDDGLAAEVYVMAADGSDARRLTDNEVPESGAELSPDNERVLFTANASAALDEFYYNDKMFVVPADGDGEPEVLLPDLPHEVNGAAWGSEGERVFFLANTGVRQNLFQVELHTGEVTQLTEGDHTLRGWSYEPGLGQHVFQVDEPENNGDVWVLDDQPGAEPRQVTGVFDHLAEDFLLPQVDTVLYPGRDGVKVEGLVFYPLDFEEGRRYPLVVQTHGGPATSDRFAFYGSSNSIQVLTAMGYMVFRPNYRGSTGYGDEFLRDMVPGYFTESHRDVMAGVDHLVERGLADEDRMAKMGWSAGGHMTNQIITYTDRFEAASSGAGAVNWISMYGTSDTRVYRTPWFDGTPWEDEAPLETYWDHSPLSRIHRVTTPTIVLVGENDLRVPKSQSVELFRALESLGVESHLYVAPRAGHGFRELRHRLFKSNVEIEWFERWLNNREYEWEEAPGDEGLPAPAANR